MVLAVLVLAGSSVGASAAVFGNDDRVNVPKRLEQVADRVGILFNNRSRTVCTAFCVADNLVATAAHCIGRGAPGNTIRYSDYSFARGYDKRREFARIEGANTGSAAQNIATGNFKLRVRPPIDAAFDWAIFKVEKGTCPAGGLPVVLRSHEELMAEAEAGRLFQVSYHRDWAQWRPAYSKPCKMGRDFEQAKWLTIAPDFLNADQMILHTCDTGGASSGSPLLIDTSEGPAVVGINVGTYVQSKLAPETGRQSIRQRSDTIANTAVSASAFAPALDAMKMSPILGVGAPMRELQERLTSLGHFTGTVDGAYSPALKAAIEAYEFAAGVPATGIANQSLLARLKKDPGRAGAVTPSSARQLGR